MLDNSWFKKERPMLSMLGFGGGSNSTFMKSDAGGGWNGVGASGGTTYDYSSPLGEFRVHKFTSTSATPFSAPGSFDRKVKYIVVGAGGGGSTPGHGGGGGSGGGGAGAVLDATNGPGNSGSGIDLTGPFNFNVTCGSPGAGAPANGSDEARGSAGGSSTVAFPTGTLTAAGGGYGGIGEPDEAGGPGGSGGGAGLYVPNAGGTGSGADFPGIPGDSPPVGWGQDGGPGGYGGQSPWSPTNPLSPFYCAGGGGGAGGKGTSGGNGRANYPGPTTAGWRTDGVGGTGYLLPEIFRSPTNKMFKGLDGPEHWVAGGGGAGVYNRENSPYEPGAPIPAAAGYAGGGGAWSPIPGQPSHPPGCFAGSGYGGLGATVAQGGAAQVAAAPAEGNSGSGGGGAGGGMSPTNHAGNGGSGVVFLAYSIGDSDPDTAAVTGSGGNITATPGNGYKYHIFTSSGAFTVSGGPGTVEALLVAGGGGGAGNTAGGGGGAGGVRSITGIRVSPGPYTITVGEGGAGNQPTYGTSGTDTTAFDLRATGGGGGTGDYGPGTVPTHSPSTSAGTPGGSGGGAKGQYPTAPTFGAGGQGNVRGVYPVEGYPGGDGAYGNGGAGGGGAGGAGGNVNSVGSSPGDPISTGGVGGAGAPYPAYAGPLFPTMPTDWKTATGPTGLYGGGGGGGAQNSPGSNQATGGTGGGGDGDTGPGDGSAGLVNTGGGGGGGGRGIGFNSPTRGFAGGDGIVIIRYSV